MLNLFLIKGIVFGSILILYHLFFSKLYTELNIKILMFILLEIILLIFLALKYKKLFLLNRVVKDKSYMKKFYILFCVMFLDFCFERKIPLLEILFSRYQHGSFYGIPVIHVLLYSFILFWYIHSVKLYIFYKKKKYLIGSYLCFVYYILLFARGGIFLLVISNIYLKIVYKKFNLKIIFKYSIAFIFALYCFGILGNLRMNLKYDDNSFILNQGKATSKFKNSLIPKEFFWSYIYAISPLGNLNYIMLNLEKIEKEIQNEDSYLREFIVDFLDKRIYKQPKTNISEYYPNPAFNVATSYSRVYITGKFIGVIFFEFIIVIISIYYLKILKKSYAQVEGIIILNIVTIFSFFDNIYIFSGISFSLVYPLFYLKYKEV